MWHRFEQSVNGHVSTSGLLKGAQNTKQTDQSETAASSRATGAARSPNRSIRSSAMRSTLLPKFIAAARYAMDLKEPLKAIVVPAASRRALSAILIRPGTGGSA